MNSCNSIKTLQHSSPAVHCTASGPGWVARLHIHLLGLCFLHEFGLIGVSSALLLGLCLCLVALLLFGLGLLDLQSLCRCLVLQYQTTQ